MEAKPSRKVTARNFCIVLELEAKRLEGFGKREEYSASVTDTFFSFVWKKGDLRRSL